MRAGRWARCAAAPPGSLASKESAAHAGQDGEKQKYVAAEEHARRAVSLMEATFGENNPRNATAYGTLAAILKCARMAPHLFEGHMQESAKLPR